MRVTLQLRHTCFAARLRPGAEVHCVSGVLWLTWEAPRMRAQSPDLVLQPGERHHVRGQGLYYLTALHPSRFTTCVIEDGRAASPPRRPAWLRLPGYARSRA